MAEALVGIIGGSGVDQIEGLVNQEWREVNSPFGCPRINYYLGRLRTIPLFFCHDTVAGIACRPAQSITEPI